jgi:hypothetical protein
MIRKPNDDWEVGHFRAPVLPYISRHGKMQPSGYP